ncbi:MAG: DUF3617 domain-containing protein [Gammaproteobacteria bacterium]
MLNQARLKKSGITTIVALIFSFVFTSLAHAESVQVEPGLWETKSVVTSPAGTQEDVTQECIKESEFSPDSMMDGAPGCTVTDSSFGSNSMQWAISCQEQGITMTGTGHAESSGDAFTGGMEISASFNGQPMNMSTTWQGKRIGACE